MNKSASIANLAFALSTAQAEMPTVKMNKTNPFLKNKYADLGSVIETSKPVLSRNGLALTQFPFSQEGRVGVTSVLTHLSGEFIEETITLVPESAKGLSINQSVGVTISYLRRYSWVSILGLYAEEDVDGDVHAGDSQDNANTDAKVKEIMKRKWSVEQTEAVSLAALDFGVTEGVSRDDAEGILNLSVLPENAPLPTVQSWTKHYLGSKGTTVLMKAMDANEAYQKAKKANGGKK